MEVLHAMSTVETIFFVMSLGQGKLHGPWLVVKGYNTVSFSKQKPGLP